MRFRSKVESVFTNHDIDLALTQSELPIKDPKTRISHSIRQSIDQSASQLYQTPRTTQPGWSAQKSNQERKHSTKRKR
jgi:hypothetical protein